MHGHLWAPKISPETTHMEVIEKVSRIILFIMALSWGFQ